MIIWKTNNPIPKDTIDSIASKIKKDDRSFRKENNFYSSYYLPTSERPEEELTSVYNNIIPEAAKKLGLFGRSTLSVPYDGRGSSDQLDGPAWLGLVRHLPALPNLQQGQDARW